MDRNHDRDRDRNNETPEFEEKVAANPENFKKLVLEFKYPEPTGPKLTDSERVPTRFEATWTDANGIPDRRRFENTPR